MLDISLKLLSYIFLVNLLNICNIQLNLRSRDISKLFAIYKYHRSLNVVAMKSLIAPLKEAKLNVTRFNQI